MKKIMIVFLFVLFPWICMAGDQVNIPWEEFKKLYKESIEKAVLDKKDLVPEPFIYSIDSGSYRIRLTPEGGEGQLTIQGASVSGEPEFITLFNKNMIIKEIRNVTGGSLLCDQKNGQGILFFPSAKEKFQIELSFYIPAQEDTRSNFVTLEIPRALKNMLELELSKELILLEAPGMKDSSGIYNFSADSSITLRFTGKKQSGKTPRIKDLSKHFKKEITPPTILDSVSYFTSFEENGNELSVLVMDVPKGAGSYLKINSIPDTEIWSLKINHKNMKVYMGEDDDNKWIIPLAKNKTSHVELAMIRHGEKLGLHGRLETILPGMELASRHVNVAIALPDRIQLISFEGALNSTSKTDIQQPKEFIGKPHYFSRSFYKGEGLRVAIIYKEPVR